MQISKVDSVREISRVEANTFEMRSKSIDPTKQSETTSVARRKGIEGAIQEALDIRKRTGQITQKSNQIPMRSIPSKPSATINAKR